MEKHIQRSNQGSPPLITNTCRNEDAIYNQNVEEGGDNNDNIDNNNNTISRENVTSIVKLQSSQNLPDETILVDENTSNPLSLQTLQLKWIKYCKSEVAIVIKKCYPIRPAKKRK